MKMADDWDLSAVVRSCRGRTTVDENIESDNPLACLASLTFEEEEDPFSFPSLVQYPVLYCFAKSDFDSKSMSSCCELQNSCKPFLPSPELCRCPIDDPVLVVSSATVGYGCRSQQQQQQLQPQEDQRRQRQTLHGKGLMLRTPLASSSTPCSPSRDTQSPGRGQKPPPPSPSSPQQFQLQHEELPHQQQQQILHCGPFLRPTQPQPPRCRKRKNQQKRTVCHVTADNLSSDRWAWRKYGQKPIKGSPYPRNYYRCSSSKGCAARKQVERSNLDPNIFIVTYSGDHTHPKPTHRNSLAGSTRNKPSPAALKSNSSADPEQSAANLSCSSPVSTNSPSPSTSVAPPLTTTDPATMNGEQGNIEDDLEKESEEPMGDEDHDEDDILIPNLTLNDQDDIFSGLQTVRLFSDGSSGQCDDGVGRSPASEDNFFL